MAIYDALVNRKTSVAVIGLGYVGLPVATSFARYFSVIGFDIDENRIQALRQQRDTNGELQPTALVNDNLIFTSDITQLQNAGFFIIAVPTPVDVHKVPDLSQLISACNIVGTALHTGDVVVFESTVFPGCTEEVCVPALAQASGLQPKVDFFFGYTPERISPGDSEHSFEKVSKLISASDHDTLDELKKIFSTVISAAVVPTSSIKVAEAAKILENTQRDLNISLLNEMSMLFDRMGINSFDVLDAMQTKWNALNFTPGLVGGHCIGVDSHYLLYKAQQLGYHPRVISAGRSVNDELPHFISRKIIQHISRQGVMLSNAKVLVLGAAFKANVRDIRNAKSADLVKDLQQFAIQVDFVDLHADAGAVAREYGLQLKSDIGSGYDVIVLAVPHRAYCEFDEAYLKSITNAGALFADLKGIYRNLIREISYWTL